MAHIMIYIKVGLLCSQDFADLCNTAKMRKVKAIYVAFLRSKFALLKLCLFNVAHPSSNLESTVKTKCNSVMTECMLLISHQLIGCSYCHRESHMYFCVPRDKLIYLSFMQLQSICNSIRNLQQAEKRWKVFFVHPIALVGI